MNYTFDHNLFLLMNFDGGEFMDTLMLSASNPMAWSWLYVLMLYLVWRHCGWKGLVMFIVVAGLALGLSDMIAGIFKHSGLLKNVWASFPARLRPMHTPELQDMIHVIARSGKYGTVSAHAATTVALAVCASMFVKRWWWTTAMVAMTLIICYSRIYLACHFPFDILLGLVTGLCSVAISMGLVKGAIWLWHKIRKEA
ncbi:MAG: phosphatase PAP2 family protein [Alistipes sp.]|nr:phosphatase PAP2 family protein [Alistipes sp.]